LSTIAVPSQFLGNALAFAEISSVTVKRALDEVNVHRAAQEKAAAFAPRLLDHMVSANVVPQANKQAAQVMLGAHDTTLQLLKAATDKIAEQAAYIAKLEARQGQKTAGDLGSGVPDSAAHEPARPHFVGQKTSDVMESDLPLLRLIGR